jgi:diguanylate cyclase (GGDEF)-like protein
MQVEQDLLLDVAPLFASLGLVVLHAMVEELAYRTEQRRKAEARLRYLGTHDPITGSLNRTSFIDAVDAARREIGEVAVILIDLRRFRAVNDTIGHEQGDELLRQVSSRLGGDPVRACARLGGDTFGVLVADAPDEALEALAIRLTDAVAEPYRLPAGHDARIAASAGGATSRISGSDATTLLEHADMALSVARHGLGNGIALFEPRMEETLQSRQAMDAALSRAVDTELFRMAYQPLIDLPSGRVAGAEALMRWRDPILGEVSPGVFIPAAEETGQIVALGRFALQEACRAAAGWDESLRISVNVSPVQFELSDVLMDVSEALAQSGLAPSRLDIEITEGIFVRDAAGVSAKLAAIREMGVGIALDDFGTGYSSLIYLAELPIDKIKIDQAFTRRLPEDSEAAAIVSAVLALGRTLGKTVVAEGIETQAQAELLRVGGCGLGQGYLFGRPVSADQFVREHVVARNAKQNAA